MQTNPALASLKDVIPPQAVSAWPLSPLMYSLVITLLIAILVIAYLVIKQHRLMQAKREALQLAKQLDQHGADYSLQLNMLLKRLTKHYYGERASALMAQPWCKFIFTVTKVQLDNQQLMTIYQKSPESNTTLPALLMQAITQFNPKEKVDV